MEVDKDNMLVVFENRMYSRLNNVHFYNSHESDDRKLDILQIIPDVKSIDIIFGNENLNESSDVRLTFQLYGSGSSVYKNICDDDFIQLTDGIDYLDEKYRVEFGNNDDFEKQEKAYFIVSGNSQVQILDSHCNLIVKYVKV